MSQAKTKLLEFAMGTLIVVSALFFGSNAWVCPAFADSGDGAGTGSPSLSMTNVDAQPGDTIDIPVTISGNPGILGMTLVVNYDDDLRLTAATKGEALSILDMTRPVSLDSGCKFHWDSTEIADGDVRDGTVLNLTFTVEPNAKAGRHLVTVEPDMRNERADVYDRELETINLAGAQCVVVIAGEVPTASVDVNIDGEGTIEGIGKYEVGSQATLNAMASKDWKFAGWYKNGDRVCATESYTFAVTGDVALVAKFELDGSAVAKPKVAVTVSIEGDGAATGAGTYDFLSEVTLTAFPNQGSEFIGWYIDAGLASSSATFTITPKSDIAYIAKFRKKQATDTPGAGEPIVGPDKPIVKPVVLRANTMKVTTAQKNVKAKKLKKASKTVKAIVVKNARGAVSYKKLSGSKKITVNKKTGAITVKKGTKKRLYKITVKVSAAGDERFEPISKNVVVKIRVK